MSHIIGDIVRITTREPFMACLNVDDICVVVFPPEHSNISSTLEPVVWVKALYTSHPQEVQEAPWYTDAYHSVKHKLTKLEKAIYDV